MEKTSNVLTTSILVLSSFLFAIAPGIYDHQGSELHGETDDDSTSADASLCAVELHGLESFAYCCRCAKNSNTERERPLQVFSLVINMCIVLCKHHMCHDGTKKEK